MSVVIDAIEESDAYNRASLLRFFHAIQNGYEFTSADIKRFVSHDELKVYQEQVKEQRSFEEYYADGRSARSRQLVPLMRSYFKRSSDTTLEKINEIIGNLDEHELLALDENLVCFHPDLNVRELDTVAFHDKANSNIYRRKKTSFELKLTALLNTIEHSLTDKNQESDISSYDDDAFQKKFQELLKSS